MLADEYPEIAKLWHHTLNGNKTPHNVKSKSSATAWWICPITGAPYQRQIYSQVTRQSPSPYVMNKKILTGYNDILTKCPEAEKYWDYNKNTLDPRKTLFNSTQKAWWKDPETNTSIQREIKTTTKRLIRNKKDENPNTSEFTPIPQPITKTHTTIIETMWDYEKNTKQPETLTPGSNYNAWWICPTYKHSYQRKVRNQLKAGLSSPIMSGHLVIKGLNDLSTTHPHIAKNWDNSNPMSPTEVTAGSEKEATWKDPSTGKTYTRRICDQVKREGRSPLNPGGKASQGNTLALHYPHIAELWHPTKNHPLTPENVPPKSKNFYWWYDPETKQEFRRTVHDMCTRPPHPPIANASGGEREIYNFIKEFYTGPIIQHSRSVIYPLELDIYMPELKIGIEFNGIYWHSEKKKPDKNYHQTKYLLAKEKNITLIMVWEDDYKKNPELIKQSIRSKMGYDDRERTYARNTTLYHSTYREAKEFCKQYHIQGSTTGSHYIGLKDKSGTIVAMSIWKKLGKELRLERYCTKTHVIGGLSKLLKEAKIIATQEKLINIITFADLSTGYTGTYEKLGFDVASHIKPDYKYVYKEKRIHKFNFRKHKFMTNPNLLFEPGKTEKELAELNGLLKIWDCGKIKYTMPVE